MDKYIIFLYFLTCILIIKKFKKKFIEKNTDIDSTIRGKIKEVYNINVSLIKKLGDICHVILNPSNGTVTLPEGINLKILGNVKTTNNVIASGYGIFGKAKIGTSHGTRYAQISHKDMFGSNNYAILQNDTGATFINSKSGKNIEFRKDDSLTDAGIQISNIKADPTINIYGNVNFTDDINSNGTITAGNNLIFNNELQGSGNKFRVAFDSTNCFIQTNKNNFKMTDYDENNKNLSVSSLETTQFDLSKIGTIDVNVEGNIYYSGTGDNSSLVTKNLFFKYEDDENNKQITSAGHNFQRHDYQNKKNKRFTHNLNWIVV